MHDKQSPKLFEWSVIGIVIVMALFAIVLILGGIQGITSKAVRENTAEAYYSRGYDPEIASFRSGELAQPQEFRELQETAFENSFEARRRLSRWDTSLPWE